MTAKSNDAKTDKSDKGARDAETEAANPVKEIGGPKGLEPTRYGDWERKGIVSDF